MTPEKAVENKIKASLEKEGYYFNKNFGGAHSKKGIPDIIGVGNGRFFAVEVKKVEGGNPTPVQIRHLQQIAKNGGLAYIACGTEVTQAIQYPNQPMSTISQYDMSDIAPEDISVSLAHSIWTNRPENVNVIQITMREGLAYA